MHLPLTKKVLEKVAKTIPFPALSPVMQVMEGF
jgi:hypothetical protein